MSNVEVYIPNAPNSSSFTYTKNKDSVVLGNNSSIIKEYIYENEKFSLIDLHNKVDFIFNSLPDEIQKNYEEYKLLKKLAK